MSTERDIRATRCRPGLSLMGAALASLLVITCADADLNKPGSDDMDAGASDLSDTAPSDSDNDAPPDLGGNDGGGNDQGSPDLGQPDLDDPDNGSDDMGLDFSEDEEAAPVCGFDQRAVEIPGTYAALGGGTRPVLIIIEAVDFENDIVFIRNVTNLTLPAREIDFDDEWRVYHNGATWASMGSARDLPAGETMAIHLTRQGFNTSSDTYLNQATLDTNACGGEIAILHNTEATGWTDHPEYLEAFVRWGNRFLPGMSSTATYTDDAFDAGAWLVDLGETNATVQTCWGDPDQDICSAANATCPEGMNDAAIIVTGDIRDPEEWDRGSAAEFEGCP